MTLRKSLFQQVMIEVGSVPKAVFAWAALSAVIGEIFGVMTLHEGNHFSRLDVIGIAIDLPVYLLASYIVVMMMIERRPSFRGALVFAGTTVVAVAVPLLLVFGGIWALPRGGGSLPLLAVLLLATAVALVLMPLLAAWPVAEAVSTGVVGPWRILRATRGNRWDLVLLAYMTTGLNRMVPSLSKARDVGHVLLFASAHVVVDGATLILASSIAVAAWKFAQVNDAGLAAAVAAAG